MRLLALWRGKLAATVDAFCAFDCLLIHALHIKKKLNAKAMAVCGTPQLSLKSADPVSWRGSHAWIVVATMAVGEIGPYLGGAAHYVVLLRIVEGWQCARIARLSNLHERITIRCVLTAVHALLLPLSLVIVEGASEYDSGRTETPLRQQFRSLLMIDAPSVRDLDQLAVVSHRRQYAIITDCAEIAHNVLTHKRKEIVERVAQLDIVVTNELARLRSQEDEHELLQLTLRWKLRSWPTWSATDMTPDKVVDYIKKETNQFFHCG
ncbi:60S ribosomal protein L32-1 [Tanacetum coccineum]|uniref:60S ribosomal protein L32-1 n=1 Tax=Tanacetum coccineum TaxID=301880 RepID=A0ABQ5C051_9ASTR